MSPESRHLHCPPPATLHPHALPCGVRISFTTQRLLALFGLGLLLFHFPLLALWDHAATVFGLPLFPTALFACWGLLIGLLGWVVERGGD